MLAHGDEGSVVRTPTVECTICHEPVDTSPVNFVMCGDKCELS